MFGELVRDMKSRQPEYNKAGIDCIVTSFWNSLKAVYKKDNKKPTDDLFSKKPPMIILLAAVREALRLYIDAQKDLQSKSSISICVM